MFFTRTHNLTLSPTRTLTLLLAVTITLTLALTLTIMTSAQVSGEGQMRQALSIVFKDGLATPFRTVGPASVTAWFFQARRAR